MHVIGAEACSDLQAPVKGLAAKDLGIRGPLKFRETVESLGSRAFCSANLDCYLVAPRSHVHSWRDSR